MKRIKWLSFRMDRDVGLAELTKALKEHPFTRDASHGFIVDEIRPSYVRAKYIKKRVIDQVVITPFGEELRQGYTTYDDNDFTISTDGPGLEITNPRRSLAELLNQIGIATHYSVSVSEISVDLNLWMQRLKRIVDNVVVTSLEYRDVLIAPKIHGHITLFGEGNIEYEVERLIKSKKHVLSRVKVSLDGYRFVLTNKAAVQMATQTPDSLVDLIRKSLPKRN